MAVYVFYLSQFFRSSRRVKMSFLYEKGRAATFCLLLCAYRFKKGSASLVFELDDYETAEAAAASSFSVFVPGSSTSPSRDFACCPKVHKGTTT